MGGAPCVADGVQQSKTFIALAAGTVRLGRGPAGCGGDAVTNVTHPHSPTPVSLMAVHRYTQI